MTFNFHASSFLIFECQTILCFKINNLGCIRKGTWEQTAEGFRFHGVKMAHAGHSDPGGSTEQALIMSFRRSVSPFFAFCDAQHVFPVIHLLPQYSGQ